MHQRYFTSPVFFLIILSITVLSVYMTAANGPYLFDDKPNIVFNDALKIKDLSLSSIDRAATSVHSITGEEPSWLARPISYLSFALNNYLADDPKWAMKVTNIVIHLVCGWLIYLLVSLLVTFAHLNQNEGEKTSFSIYRWFPLLVASVWLCHPVLVSTVLYSVQRMTQLSAMFSLCALISFCHFRYRLLKTGTGFWYGFVFVAAFTALAFLSKQNGFLSLLLCAVIEVHFFRGRFFAQVGSLYRQAYYIALTAPVVFIVIYLSFHFFNVSDAQISSRLFNSHERLLTESRVVFDYLVWFFYPAPTNVNFLHDNYLISKNVLTPLTTLWSLIFWFSLVCIILYCIVKERFRWFSFGISWFLVAHLLESTTLNLELVFEHRNYLPYVGLAIVAVFLLVNGLRRVKVSVSVLGAMLIALCLLIPLSLTAERVKHWQSDDSLLNHWGEVNQRSPRYWAKLADFQYQHGELESSLHTLAQAEKLAGWEEGFSLASLTILCITDRLETFEQIDHLVGRTKRSMELLPTTSYSVTQYATMIIQCPPSLKLLPIYLSGINNGNSDIAAKSHFMLGLIALQDGNKEDAHAHFTNVLELDNNADEAKKMLEFLEGV